jgi:sulfur carrier protein ThiS
LKEKIKVFVNDKPLEIFQGMQVKHALISYDIDIYKKCIDGEYIVVNEDGFEIGLEGALSNNTKIYIKRRREKSCLERPK